MPELIASELARGIAAELAGRLDDEEDGNDGEAVGCFVGVISGLPMGDVIGARALIDCAPAMLGLFRSSTSCAIAARPTGCSRRARGCLMWVPEIGQLEMTLRRDAAPSERAIAGH